MSRLHKCPSCSCVKEDKKHVHRLNVEPNVEPSYIIRTNTKLEKVWMCNQKGDWPCPESKREVSNA